MVSIKDFKSPLSWQTVLAAFFILNGAWLLIRLAEYPVPLGNIESLQRFSVWCAGFASVYGGIHIIAIRFRHKAVKSLL